MKTVPFQESYRQTFIDLNSRWITSAGWNPPTWLHLIRLTNLWQKAVCFFAVENGTVLDCCGVVPLSDGTWELEKWDPIRKFPTEEPVRQFFSLHELGAGTWCQTAAHLLQPETETRTAYL